MNGGSATNPSSQRYFFGRISRDEAEQFLKNAGCTEGLFLLREKVEIGNYALSLCHENRYTAMVCYKLCWLRQSVIIQLQHPIVYRDLSHAGVQSYNSFHFFSVRIHHYSIERQPDNRVMIQDGQKFIGPVELIQHHSDRLDGFLTKPQIPCERPTGYPIAWPGVTYYQLETALYDFAEKNHLTVSTYYYAFQCQLKTRYWVVL